MGRQARVIMLAVLVAVTLAVGAAVFAAEEEPAVETVNDYKELRHDVEELRREDERIYEKINDRTEAIEKRIGDQYSIFLVVLAVLAVVGIFVVWYFNHRRSLDIKELENEYSKLSERLNECDDIIKEMVGYREKTKEITESLGVDSERAKVLVGEIEKAKSMVTRAAREFPPISDEKPKTRVVEELLEKYPKLKENTEFLYSAAIKKDINDEETLFGITKSLHINEEYEKALEIIDLLISKAPKNSYFYSTRGFLLSLLERHKDAVDAQNIALELDPDNPLYLVRKGSALTLGGKYKKAVESFDEAINQGYEPAGIYSGKGIALEKLRKFKEAIKAHDKAVKIGTEPVASLFYLRATTYSVWGKKEFMLTDLRQAIYLDKSYRGEVKTDELFKKFYDDPDFRRLIFPEEFEREEKT